MRWRASLVAAVLGTALMGACESYDPPEQADPLDTIAPAPKENAPVPGMDDPDA